MCSRRNSLVLALAAVAAFASTNTRINADGPAPIPPVNDVANPYTTITDFFKLPEGRKWGSTSTIDVDKDGKSIWVAERCGGNSCLDAATGQIKDVATVMKFDEHRQAGDRVRRRPAHLPARHACRPRRQRLGDRRPGQRAASGARRRRRRQLRRGGSCGGAPQAAGGRRCVLRRRSGAAAGAADPARDQGTPGLQVQPRRQSADDHRQAWRRHRRRRMLLPAERRDHLA